MAQLSPAAVRPYQMRYCAPNRVMSSAEALDLRGKLEVVEALGRFPTRRIGLAVRSIPTCVRQTAGMTDSAMLVRRCDRFGHFRAEQRPLADPSDAAMAHHVLVTGASSRTLMRGTDRTLGGMAGRSFAEGSKGASKSRCAMPASRAARTATL
jgi:hypothetical protein